MPLPAREKAPERTSMPAAGQETARLDEEARRIAAGIAAGDEKAFRELYDLYQPRLTRLALVLGRGDDSLAHEIVQAVFLTAASKLGRVDSEEHLWNWLARVARQQISKAWKRSRNAPQIVPVEEIPEPAELTQNDATHERLDEALNSMECDERQLVEWFYFDKLSHKEIAGQLGVSPKAVSSRLERARARLRALLFKDKA
jgi:RNA polymerase sigma factor (sigma-70 family)